MGHGNILSWKHNNECDLAGYKLYYGHAPGNYTNSLVLGKRSKCDLSLLNLSKNTSHYVVLTAYDLSGNESGFSDFIEFFADDDILPDEDNCPAIYDPNQEDNDLDGSGDSCDRDDDNDEILDSYDNCSKKYHPNQKDTDDDGREDICYLCPLVAIYGEHSKEIEILRYYRDHLLNNSPEGREIIKLYYQWSPVIIRAMEADEDFKGEVGEIIDQVMEMTGVVVE